LVEFALVVPVLLLVVVAIAAVLGLLVVAGLMSTRLGPRANVPGNHKATSVRLSTPSPSVDYGPPPAGVPLVYVHDPGEPSWLIGYDWSGKPRGTVKLAADVAPDPSAVRMSPDGSGFEVGGTYKGGTGTFLDRLGHLVVTETGSTGLVGAMWADDSQHQCVLTLSSTYVWRLATQLPGHALRPVAVIARDKGIGQSGISLAACSLKNDVAIAVRTTIAWPAELWVIRLSDGTVLGHHAYSASARLSTVVASPDGTYVAESSAKGLGDTSNGATSTVIRLVSVWRVVRSLDSSVQVLGFSGDGSQVLTIMPSGNAPNQNRYATFDWRSSRIAWSYEGIWALYSFTPQPTGSNFTIALGDSPIPRPPCVTSSACPAFVAVRVILIAKPDGSTTVLHGDYIPAW
jgi:hypothetical protein